MNRREMLAGAAALVASATQPIRAQDADLKILGSPPPLPNDLAANAGGSPMFEPPALVASAKPLSGEIEVAYDILVGSPFGCAPIEVAEYFLSVGAGAYGQDWRSFAREWPIRANPVIYHFFASTLTKPAGDTTAWCAAFANWCILRAKSDDRDAIGISPGAYSKSGKPFLQRHRLDHTTNSASSGSFRCFPETSAPRRGDIVVFRDIGTDSLTAACQGTGHVAFYLGQPRSGYARVVGGNQTSPGSGGAVTIADMSLSPAGRFLKFVSLK